MKQLLPLLLSFLLLSGNIYSTPIDVKNAQKVARSFFENNDQVKTRKSGPVLVAEYYSKPKSIVSFPCMYVFNKEGGNGFVIVSADDRVVPVLAYSNEGNFDPEKLNTNTQYFINDYQQQIEYIVMNNLQGDADTKEQWEKLLNGNISINSTPLLPTMIETTWNQEPYYNAYCPVDERAASGNTLAGCVAVGMAQIMKYWEYPKKGNGTHEYIADYTTDGEGGRDYGKQYVDFENANYNYEKMPVSLTSESTQEEIDAVAELIYHCGVAVEMKYGPTLSTAYPIDPNNGPSAQKALKEIFGYSATTDYFRQLYNDQAWMKLLKDELNIGRPILYSAKDDSYGAHVFVCDGYDKDGYFHFNWGWAGANDGYYYINNLNPAGYNFKANHQVIMNIYPESDLVAMPDMINFEYNHFLKTDPQVVNVSANANITTTISITTQAPFCISTDSIHWRTEDTLPAIGGKFYVKYIPTEEQYDKGEVLISNDSTYPCKIKLTGDASPFVTQYPWFVSFEDSVYHSLVQHQNDDGDWIMQSEGIGSDYLPELTNSYLYAGQGNRIFTTPVLSLSALTDPKLYFKMKGEDASLKVYYQEYPNGEYQQLGNFTTESTSLWDLKSLQLSLCTNCRVVFEGQSLSNDGYVMMDDIMLVDLERDYIIRSAANVGGAIEPEGIHLFSEGENVTYQFMPELGQELKKLIVDGEEVDLQMPYTFTNVQADHQIEAVFGEILYPEISVDQDTLFFSALLGGHSEMQYLTIVGTDIFTPILITASLPFEVLQDTLWTNVAILPPEGGVLPIRYIPTILGEENSMINISNGEVEGMSVVLKGVADKRLLTISALSNVGGQIYPEGISTVEEGESLTYTFEPNDGYKLAYLFIDGTMMEPVATYTFDDIDRSHDIYAFFESTVGVVKENEEKIIIFPNPVTEVLHLFCPNLYTEVEIFDLRGNLVQGIHGIASEGRIDVSSLAKGVYFVRIKTEGKVITRKVFKK